jgi:hypothetical protein
MSCRESSQVKERLLQRDISVQFLLRYTTKDQIVIFLEGTQPIISRPIPEPQPRRSYTQSHDGVDDIIIVLFECLDGLLP